MRPIILIMDSERKLKTLKKQLFTARDAQSAGVSPAMMSYLVRKGAIERRGQGLYAFPGSEPTDLVGMIAEKLAVVPQGIIGLQTALLLHGLTDELPGNIEIFVPDRNAPKRKLSEVTLHRVRGDIQRIRTKTIKGIPVTSVEQTLIDLLRNGTPLSQLIEIFRLAQRKRLRPSATELTRIAADFRIKGRAKVLVEALL